MSNQLQIRCRPLQDFRVASGESRNSAATLSTQRPIPIVRSERERGPLLYFSSLEADSHLPEVQTIIREAIHRGTIRVHPIPGCSNRVRIAPVEPSAYEVLAVR